MYKGFEAEDNPPVGENPGKSWRGLPDHNILHVFNDFPHYHKPVMQKAVCNFYLFLHHLILKLHAKNYEYYYKTAFCKKTHLSSLYYYELIQVWFSGSGSYNLIKKGYSVLLQKTRIHTSYEYETFRIQCIFQVISADSLKSTSKLDQQSSSASAGSSLDEAQVPARGYDWLDTNWLSGEKRSDRGERRANKSLNYSPLTLCDITQVKLRSPFYQITDGVRYEPSTQPVAWINLLIKLYKGFLDNCVLREKSRNIYRMIDAEKLSVDDFFLEKYQRHLIYCYRIGLFEPPKAIIKLNKFSLSKIVSVIFLNMSINMTETKLKKDEDHKENNIYGRKAEEKTRLNLSNRKLTLQKKLCQLPEVDMQKLPGSFCCYSNHAPKLLCQKFYIGKHVEFEWKLGWSMLHFQFSKKKTPLFKKLPQCCRNQFWELSDQFLSAPGELFLNTKENWESFKGPKMPLSSIFQAGSLALKGLKIMCACVFGQILLLVVHTTFGWVLPTAQRFLRSEYIPNRLSKKSKIRVSRTQKRDRIEARKKTLLNQRLLIFVLIWTMSHCTGIMIEYLHAQDIHYKRRKGGRYYMGKVYYKRRKVLYREGYIIKRGGIYIQWIGYGITRGGGLSCIQWTRYSRGESGRRGQ
ncbi:hypothetical protein VP01_3577g1 [Puccinia sorghi]|uniref:Uncharacterized protein n=1 Tax=Puccinia sorghi TaxID=27349 RepID=A0A0L6UV87_9BASI|nr:hypothetical protein VP01_3577g1 [Puccinia sorghi]